MKSDVIRTSHFSFYTYHSKRRGISSIGRAPALHAGGQEFESLILHLQKKIYSHLGDGIQWNSDGFDTYNIDYAVDNQYLVAYKLVNLCRMLMVG